MFEIKKDIRSMTEAELAKLNESKKQKEQEILATDSDESEKEMKEITLAKPKELSHSQNALIALEQMRANMAPQMDMQKFNLLRFAFDFLYHYLQENCKKEIAAAEAP